MPRILILIAGLALLLVPLQSARAQATVELKDLGVEYTFGEKITFAAMIQTKASLQTASVVFQEEGNPSTHSEVMKVTASGKATYVHFIQNGLIRPFARVYYWYHLILSNSAPFDSPHYSFQYDDNRYLWQTLDGTSVVVHWVTGDLSFGQAAFGAANAGYNAIQTMMPISAGGPINIYIYASAADVQDTLNLGGYTWVGGHASPDIGVVLVSIASGETQSIEMERQIPHELAHVLLYRLTGPAYANLPTWLQEGIASQAERYPNANFAPALSLAVQNQSLLPISELCGPFPAVASEATLAYAESDSFTRYLQNTYGTTGLQKLIQAYTGGLTCEQGAERALGFSLSRLDQDWRQAILGQKATEASPQSFLSYLLLLVIILVIPAWRLFGTPNRGIYDRTQSK